jgi:hypothetical protein
MSDDYYSYTEQLVPEGRRVFALIKACELADDRTPAADILAKAQAFEAWLKEAASRGRPDGAGVSKPRIAAVKPGD